MPRNNTIAVEAEKGQEQTGLGSCSSDEEAALGTAKSHGATYFNLGKLPVITQSDLDNAIAKAGGMALWEPKKYLWLKTLAAAASGKGSVELMASLMQKGRTVAVKKLPWELVRSCPEEFKKERPKAKESPWMDIAIVKHLTSLGCPFLCKFLGIFRKDDQVCIMTSFANRGDLFQWCQRDASQAGPAREATIRPIVSQIFTGVCWLHNLGVAHCDLSLENLMLSETSEKGLQVRIIDFGMASLSRRCDQTRGKRSYQAPEMHEGVEYDLFLADNFAVGIIVYCMAVRYYPWEVTKPGKDVSCEFAKQHGLEAFLRKKKMPCDKRPIASVFSQPYLDLVCGLLAFNTELRYSLGEVCFGHSPLATSLAASQTMEKQMSDMSTTDSLGTHAQDVHSEAEGSDLDCNLDDDKSKHRQLRTSVWDSRWLVEIVRDVPQGNH